MIFQVNIFNNKQYIQITNRTENHDLAYVDDRQTLILQFPNDEFDLYTIHCRNLHIADLCVDELIATAINRLYTWNIWAHYTGEDNKKYVITTEITSKLPKNRIYLELECINNITITIQCMEYMYMCVRSAQVRSFKIDFNQIPNTVSMLHLY